MNTYYVLAILFLALSALFGYLGSNKSSDQQLDKISNEFKSLGEQIESLNTDEVTASEIDAIEEKYRALAQDYMESLPAEAQSLQVAKEEKKLELITTSAKYSEQLNFIRSTAKSLIAAFRHNGAKIEYSDMLPPKNLFSGKGFQLKLSASNSEYWSIRLVDQTPQNIGIMFVRMTVDENGQNYLTDDSVVFRWVDPNQFGFSRNSNLSDEVQRKVMSNLSDSIQAIGSANDQLDILIQNIIKYILAKEEAQNA